jgi:hypothetical protein
MELEPSNQSIGVHGVGTKQIKVLVSMELEPSNQSLGVHGVGTKQSKSWCPWSWNQANQSLGVYGVGTKQPKSWCPWIWNHVIFSLQMPLTRSFDVDDAPCKLDGGRELNNAVVYNRHMICVNK